MDEEVGKSWSRSALGRQATTKRGDPTTRAKTGASSSREEEEDPLLRSVREEDGIWWNECGRVECRLAPRDALLSF